MAHTSLIADMTTMFSSSIYLGCSSGQLILRRQLVNHQTKLCCRDNEKLLILKKVTMGLNRVIAGTVLMPIALGLSGWTKK